MLPSLLGTVLPHTPRLAARSTLTAFVPTVLQASLFTHCALNTPARAFASSSLTGLNRKKYVGSYGELTMQQQQTSIKIACLQLAVGADKPANIQNANEKIAEAARNGAELVILPECMNSPYGVKYFPEYAENVIEGQSETAIMLSKAARENKVFLIGGSFPEKGPDGYCLPYSEGVWKLYNSCYSFNHDGDMVALHKKIHLFDIDIPGQITFKESDALSPGDTPTIFDLSEHGGPPVRIGIGICYDIRFPELCLMYRQLGCNMLVFPGAFNLVTGAAHWELLARSRAMDTQSFVAFCSPSRDMSADYNAWGHTMVTDPWGEIVGQLDENPDILYADLDLTQPVTRRLNMPYHLQKRKDVYQLTSRFLEDPAKPKK